MDMTRREALGAAAVAGVCAPLLAACGASSANGGTNAGTTGGGGLTAGAGGGAASGITVKAADVPVGGGTITDGVVITQPTAGTFKAFTAICTHQGTQLSAISDGEIICPRHGSRFSIATGDADQGPATNPLTERALTVKNGTITVQS